MERTKNFLHTFVKEIREGAFLLNKYGELELVNGAFLSLLGKKEQELYKVSMDSLDLVWSGFSSFYSLLHVLKEKGRWEGIVTGVNARGYMFTVRATLFKVKEDLYAGIITDVPVKVSSEQGIHRTVYYDKLTGLPTVNALMDYVAKLIGAEGKGNVALISFDIDDMKVVNTSFGYKFGDALLKEFANRLVAFFPHSSFIARSGGDKFAVVFKGQAKEVYKKVEMFLKTCLRPFDVGGKDLYVTLSAGISFYPQHGKDPRTLLRNSEIALYWAKKRCKGSYIVFSDDIGRKLAEQFMLLCNLRRAFRRGEFVLHYQPQIELCTEHLVGLEALIRWQHPEKGLVFPSKFIKVLENSELIVPLGKWVLKQACSDGKKLLDIGFPLKMAVNVSARQLSHDEFVSTLEKLFRETGFEPSLLEIEITENTLMENRKRVTEILGKIKSMGISVAIDDFGTSYSSLSYLKYLPVDKLKIDKVFIDNIATNPNDVALATTIIAIAHNLGLKAVAEGVETQKQALFLKLWQCDEAQGYFFSPPLPLDSIIDMLRAGRYKVKD